MDFSYIINAKNGQENLNNKRAWIKKREEKGNFMEFGAKSKFLIIKQHWWKIFRWIGSRSTNATAGISLP